MAGLDRVLNPDLIRIHSFFETLSISVAFFFLQIGWCHEILDWVPVFQCCGSGMFIPDPNFFHPGSRIRIKKESKYFNPKNCSLSQKYDPGSSSRIRILILYPSWIPDPGANKGTGSRIRIRITALSLCDAVPHAQCRLTS